MFGGAPPGVCHPELHGQRFLYTNLRLSRVVQQSVGRCFMSHSTVPSRAFQNGLVQGRSSFAWRLILPVPLTILLAIVLIWVIVPRIVASVAVNDAVLANQQAAAEFKIIRAYYSDYIVNKVVKGGTFKATHDHKTKDAAIPLPATFLHDLTAALKTQQHDGQPLQPISLSGPQGPQARRISDGGVGLSQRQSRRHILAHGDARRQTGRARGRCGQDVQPILHQLPQFRSAIAQDGLEARATCGACSKSTSVIDAATRPWRDADAPDGARSARMIGLLMIRHHADLVTRGVTSPLQGHGSRHAASSPPATSTWCCRATPRRRDRRDGGRGRAVQGQGDRARASRGRAGRCR